MKKKVRLTAISFADYQRLYRVIATVLNGADAHTAHACKFFAIAGAYILTKSHGLDAKPRFGSAFFQVNEPSSIALAFTDMEAFERNELHSHNEAFHAWIECDGIVIDLLAPLFRENYLSKQPNSKLRLPRKMLQKPKSHMASSPLNLTKEGDFYLSINPTLTNEMIKEFTRLNANTDLVDVCCSWYAPTPKKITSELEIESNNGVRTRMQLDSTELSGVW